MHCALCIVHCALCIVGSTPWINPVSPSKPRVGIHHPAKPLLECIRLFHAHERPAGGSQQHLTGQCHVAQQVGERVERLGPRDEREVAGDGVAADRFVVCQAASRCARVGKVIGTRTSGRPSGAQANSRASMPYDGILLARAHLGVPAEDALAPRRHVWAALPGSRQGAATGSMAARDPRLPDRSARAVPPP